MTSTIPLRYGPLLGGAILVLALAGCSSLPSIPNPFKPGGDPVSAIPGAVNKVEAPKIPGNDSIPVVVNDHPITRFDIDQRLKLMQVSGAKGDQKVATSDLVDEVLQLEEAAKFGIVIKPDQVNAAFAQVAGNLKLSPDGLAQALAQEGIDPNTLKRRLLAQITWNQLVVKRAQETGQIKEADVTSALLAKGDSAKSTKQYTLQQIVFVVPSGSSAGTFEQRSREAEAFRQRFQGCDKTLAQAKSLNGVVVKDIGRRDANDLTGGQGDAIKNTKAGGTLRPSQTNQGVEVIAVCDIKDIQSTAAARADIENQLFAKESESIADDYLKALRKQATIVYR